jgi:small subunit ribosomal protein S19
MTRSVWKGKFVSPKVLRQLYFLSKSDLKDNILYTLWSRNSTILPDFIGLNIQIHNGQKFSKIIVDERMVNFKFGEFSFTKKMGKKIHPIQAKTNKKKKKK